MNIENLKNRYFWNNESYYEILETFGLLDKIELLKNKYKNGELRTLLQNYDLYSIANEHGWDRASGIISNLEDTLTKERAADLVLKAGSVNELVDEIYLIYAESALREVALYLMYLADCE